MSFSEQSESMSERKQPVQQTPTGHGPTHAGTTHVTRMGHPAPSVTQPAAPPIFQTAAFDVPDLNVLDQMTAGLASGHIYTRDSNPNHEALASCIAALEGVDAGAVFASGMGAIASVFLTLASSGDHVIMARSLYGRTLQLAERMRQQFGLNILLVDQCSPDQFAKVINSRTRFAIVETVSNPLLEVTDIEVVSKLLHPIPLVVDATFTTPQLSRPCHQGAAISLHSASKYLNGHGDVMLGVAAGSHDMMKRLRETASVFGQNANPFESWLCQRGLRTLPLRMRQICETTVRIASFLVTHPAVRRVYHPSLPDHPSFSTASRLYPNGTGGVISFELVGNGTEIVNRFMQNSPSIPFSPTLADARTTVSYPAGTSHRFMTETDRRTIGITAELVRLSIGLEPYELLESDLRQSLDSLLSQ